MVSWVKIKKEYLEGVMPKELAGKYKVSAKSIHEKASREGWVDERTSINKNLQESVQERIKSLTNLALDTLADVINSPETEKNVKVQAAKALLDISGLKRQEINGSGLAANVIINRESVCVESNN